jgi:hypothetical protein
MSRQYWRDIFFCANPYIDIHGLDTHGRGCSIRDFVVHSRDEAVTVQPHRDAPAGAG